MKQIYIAGPMTGIKDMNFPAFNAETKRLRALGYDVVNPAEIVTDKTTPWNIAMRKDIIALMACDTIVFLVGWENSKGAWIEYKLGHDLGMKCFKENEIRIHKYQVNEETRCCYCGLMVTNMIQHRKYCKA